MSKMSDISEEGQQQIWSLIYGNQLRNFQMMNAMHTCSKCENEGLLFAEMFLKLGFEPFCDKCATPTETHNLNALAEIFKSHDDTKKFEWVTGKDKHRKNPSGRGCQTCQPGMED